jgi:hypothetical protein
MQYILDIYGNFGKQANGIRKRQNCKHYRELDKQTKVNISHTSSKVEKVHCRNFSKI